MITIKGPFWYLIITQHKFGAHHFFHHESLVLHYKGNHEKKDDWRSFFFIPKWEAIFQNNVVSFVFYKPLVLVFSIVIPLAIWTHVCQIINLKFSFW
jgi:hypothetical protein